MMQSLPGGNPRLQTAIQGKLVRIVESQQQVATTGLVGDLFEQALLEDMLEATKPPVRDGAEDLHYLLATPFRYPPLRHGSRFGSAREPALFYGSRQVSTALAETAYYRFVFWLGMKEPPPSRQLISQHTALGARYRSMRGLRLQMPPFDVWEQQLKDPQDYSFTQRLGTTMREAGVQAFECLSARTPKRAVNIGLFTPNALVGKQPLYLQLWLCETRAERVNFSAAGSDSFHTFPLDSFQVEGVFPHPAT